MGHCRAHATVQLLVALAAIATCALVYTTKFGALDSFDYECLSHDFMVRYIWGRGIVIHR